MTDRPRADRTMLAVLVVYTGLWTLYGLIAKSGQDLHPDMTELVTWGHETALGYFKHPPLAAWVVKAWFSVFPYADWSFYLLAAVIPSAGLWIVWRLTATYLDQPKRVTAVALLTLVPFYGPISLKFNVNTLLIPLWAATVLCFLRVFETRRPGWAVLAGLCAAAAMLTKYWSIWLIAGLVLAALMDPRRTRFLQSAAPYIVVAVGLAALSPHLVWLVENDFPPIRYVDLAHPSSSLASSAKSAAGYLAGCAAYVLLPVGIVLAAARRRADLAQMLWPQEPERRLVARAFWLPLLLPIVPAVAMSKEIAAIWSMAAWSLLPLVLLAPRALELSTAAMDRIVALAMAFPLVMLAASPFVAVAIDRAGLPPDQTLGNALAREVETVWAETTAEPLRIVGGDNAYGLAFYLPGKPSAFPYFSFAEARWIDRERLAREGLAAVCNADHRICVKRARRLAEQWEADNQVEAIDVREVEVSVARESFGVIGKPERYFVWALPPRR